MRFTVSRPTPAPERVDDGWRLGDWQCRVDQQRPVLSRLGEEAARDDWWRVLAAASWEYLDRTGAVVDITAVRVPAATPSAR